jgi:hypothetical protein
MPPTQSPEKVARAIVRLTARPRHQVYVPRIAALGVALHSLVPRTTERLLFRAVSRWHFDDQRQSPTKGNLDEPTKPGKGETHGQREAALGTPRFAAWAFVELSKMAVESVRRFLGTLIGRAETRLAPAKG